MDFDRKRIFKRISPNLNPNLNPNLKAQKRFRENERTSFFVQVFPLFYLLSGLAAFSYIFMPFGAVEDL